MTFWNGERLAERLTSLVAPADPSAIDCAAYTLSIGQEVYISPTDLTVEPQQQTVRRLADGEAFTIPPGQFAFLTTRERVTVPTDAIAFISMKARIKFRGLINVSGFHVDPGFSGNLVFAVFNAGPAPVHLKQGDPCFLIWYADLNAPSDRVKQGPGHQGLPTEIINAISGELQSFQGLAKRIKDVEKDLGKQIQDVRVGGAYYNVVASILLAVALLFAGNLIREWMSPKPSAPALPAVSAAPSAKAPSPAPVPTP